MKISENLWKSSFGKCRKPFSLVFRASDAIWMTFSHIRHYFEDFFAYPMQCWLLFRISDNILATFSGIRCNFDDFFVYPLLFLPSPPSRTRPQRPRSRAQEHAQKVQIIARAIFSTKHRNAWGLSASSPEHAIHPQRVWKKKSLLVLLVFGARWLQSDPRMIQKRP